MTFLFQYLLSSSLKIINSVVVVGFYYGFLTIFSIGPSYLFLLRARVMEEGNEKQIWATTGFITGQLVMFISIYYTPMHLALRRPHTITVLVVPYLFFHFLWNNSITLGFTTRRNLSIMDNRIISIACVFLNNLIFPLFNHFILPNSTLARLVSIYMFRCNNKILFTTSSFLGWLFGQFLFMKLLGFILSHIRLKLCKEDSIWNSRVNRTFTISLLITLIYYLGRMPFAITTKKLLGDEEIQRRRQMREEFRKEEEEENEEEEERKEREKELKSQGEIERWKEEERERSKQKEEEMERVKQELELEEKVKKKEHRDLIISLFDFERWNRPLRYIENDPFGNAVRDEISQFHFNPRLSDGKQRVSFTNLPTLSLSSKRVDKVIAVMRKEAIVPKKNKTEKEEKRSHQHENNYLYNQLFRNFVDTNEQQKMNLSTELTDRIQAMENETKSLLSDALQKMDVLEKRNRLYLSFNEEDKGNEENKGRYLPKQFDPLLILNGPCRRGKIKIKDDGAHSHLSRKGLTTSRQKRKKILQEEKKAILKRIPEAEKELEAAEKQFEETKKRMRVVQELVKIHEEEEQEKKQVLGRKLLENEMEVEALRAVSEANLISQEAYDLIARKGQKEGEEQEDKDDLKEEQEDEDDEEEEREEMQKKLPRWSYKLTSQLYDLQDELYDLQEGPKGKDKDRDKDKRKRKDKEEEDKEEDKEEERTELYEIRSRKARPVLVFNEEEEKKRREKRRIEEKRRREEEKKKQEDKKEEDKKQEDKKEEDKKEGDKKQEDKKEGDKKQEDKKEGDKKQEDKKEEDKKEEDKKEGDKKDKEKGEGDEDEGDEDEGDEDEDEGDEHEGDEHEGDEHEGDEHEGDEDEGDEDEDEGDEDEGDEDEDEGDEDEGDEHEGEKHEGEKYEAEKHEAEKYEAEKYEVQKREVRRYKVQKYKGEKHEVQKYKGEKHEVQKNEVQKNEGEKNEVQKYEGEKHEVQKYEGEKNEVQKNKGEEEDKEGLYMLRFSQQSDFSRGLIAGSMRVQRRKTVIWKMFEENVHSPLFLDQIHKTPFFDFSKMINLIFQKGESEILTCDSESEEEETKSEEEETKSEKETKEKKKRKREKEREEEEKQNIRIISELWDTIPFAQPIRGLLLVTQSFLRKYIKLPFSIIAKNIGRMLLLQSPEWLEDLRDWNKEIHVKCTYNAIPLSEIEFPENWLTDGIQIKIVFPLHLKPWRGAKTKIVSDKNKKEKEGSFKKEELKKKKKGDFFFLNVWGEEVKTPFSSKVERNSFFKPIFKELKKRYIKRKKLIFLVLKVLKKIRIWFLRILKEKTKEVLEKVLVIKKEIEKRKELIIKVLKTNLFLLNENEKNSKSNKNTQELIIEPMDWTNYSLVEMKEKELKDLIDRTINTRNQIEQIKKEKAKIIPTPNINDKKSKSWKYIWLIFKREKARLICKLHYFIKSFIQRIYIDIFLYIINILRVNVQFFVKSVMEKTNQEETDIDENLILSIKEKFNSENSNPYSDLSALSQAYVFYKIAQSQAQVNNKYNLRSLLQYDGTPLFLKDEIKDYCETQGIFDFKCKHRKINKSTIDEWKGWLKSHYQYNLSQTEWSQLAPKKWRNRVNRHCRIQNENSIKRNLYKKEKEKDSLIRYVKNKYYNEDETDLSISQKEKFQKNYKYNLLLDKYISYEDSYISELPLEVNKDRKSYNFNQSFYLLTGIDLSDYLREKKYFNCKTFDFDFDFLIKERGKMEPLIESRFHRYGYEKFYNKNILSSKIYQKRKRFSSNLECFFFDWMGTNQHTTFDPTVSNLKLPFFPELGITYIQYMFKPWIIPTKLLFHFDVNENASQNPNINENKKEDLELEKKNQEKKQKSSQVDPGFDVQKQEKKDIEENSKGSKKEDKRIEKEFEILMKKYVHIELGFDGLWSEKVKGHIKGSSFLLRLEDDNPKPEETSILSIHDFTISSIQINDMDLDALVLTKRKKKENLFSKLCKKRLLCIEPVRLSGKWDENSIMYQIISISLVHENKYQINEKCIKEKSVDKNDLEKPIAQQYSNNYYDFLIPEYILSTRHRRKLRILICLNSWNRNVVNGISLFGNENNGKNCEQFMNEDKYTHRNKLMKFKLFLWPNYRLEDLACMNRYWFNTNNGSRFTMTRIRMYPRL